MKLRNFLILTLLLPAVFMANICQAENPFGPEAMKQSFTHKNTQIKYRPGVLVIGNRRENVYKAFGAPNGTDVFSGGGVEDVYIFTPDGSKYVTPHPRPRNVALAVVTGGVSIAVHQSLLAYQRSNLTIYRVYYQKNLRIVRVIREKGSAFKFPETPR